MYWFPSQSTLSLHKRTEKARMHPGKKKPSAATKCRNTSSSSESPRQKLIPKKLTTHLAFPITTCLAFLSRSLLTALDKPASEILVWLSMVNTSVIFTTAAPNPCQHSACFHCVWFLLFPVKVTEPEELKMQWMWISWTILQSCAFFLLWHPVHQHKKQMPYLKLIFYYRSENNSFEMSVLLSHDRLK